MHMYMPQPYTLGGVRDAPTLSRQSLSTHTCTSPLSQFLMPILVGGGRLSRCSRLTVKKRLRPGAIGATYSSKRRSYWRERNGAGAGASEQDAGLDSLVRNQTHCNAGGQGKGMNACDMEISFLYHTAR